ncbi:MAG: rRNA maturation RNase YbeY [Bacteroidetes bacterium]|nr:MAG: rRNA maturation RNase YbeY [Bacteroidota bacterium]
MNEEKIHFFTEGISYQIRRKNAIRDGIKRLIREKKRKPSFINIISCSDNVLRRYNKKYLRRSYYTDILAFDFSDDEGIIAGDIYISIDRVRENAKKYSIPIQMELARVIIHGILHLTGMKDATEEEKREMRREEDFYISTFVKY